jgi:lysozyme
MRKFLKSLTFWTQSKKMATNSPTVSDMNISTSPKSSSKTESQNDPEKCSAGGCEQKPLGSKIDEAQLIRQLKLHEGVKLKAYKCTADKTTIGVGRNLDDLGITEEEADYLLANDIDRVKVALSREIPWMTDLDDVRQRVLLDMAFNLGISGLMQFKKTLKAIQDKDFERAGRMMLDSKWATQVGKRADRLSVMMNIGKDPKDLWPPTL